MKRDDLKKEFFDTDRYYKKNKLVEFTNTFYDKMYFNKSIGSDDHDVKEGIIEVVNSDTVSAIMNAPKGKKVAVLNMASAFNCGGGVVTGAKAQEEDLCRCSNLYAALKEITYPIPSNTLWYTENVTFFKNKEYNYVNERVVDVITHPAMNMNRFEFKHLSVKDYENALYKNIELMLSIADKNDVDHLILGAWGCGVFKNDPNKISEVFNEILYVFNNQFDKVEFAIINDGNSVSNNFKVFEKGIDCDV